MEIEQLKIQCAIKQPISSWQILVDNLRQVFMTVEAKYNNYSAEGMRNVGVATKQHRDIWSSFMLIPKLRAGGELAVCKLIDWFCGEKHLPAWRQHPMAPVCCCEPELLNLYSATLCQVDLPACTCACSRVSAPKLCGSPLQWAMMLLVRWGVKDQGLSASLLRDIAPGSANVPYVQTADDCFLLLLKSHLLSI